MSYFLQEVTKIYTSSEGSIWVESGYPIWVKNPYSIWAVGVWWEEEKKGQAGVPTYLLPLVTSAYP